MSNPRSAVSNNRQPALTWLGKRFHTASTGPAVGVQLLSSRSDALCLTAAATAVHLICWVLIGLRLEHRLQVDQMVIEDFTSDIQQLKDLRVAHRVVHAGSGASSVNDAPRAQNSQ